MTRAARCALVLAAVLTAAAPAARAAEDTRALVIEGEELLATNPQRALETFQRVRALLGATPVRLQVDLVRAAAAVGDDVLTQAEYAAWLRLPKRDPAVDAELRALAEGAAANLQGREQRESAAAARIESEQRLREAEAKARDAATARAREADVQFAAEEAKRALRSSESSAAESAIRRIDRVTALYPDDPRLGELAAARADRVTHAALARQAEAGLAAAAAQKEAKARSQRARRHYLIGAAELIGGVAVTATGVYLLVAQPADLGQPASVAIGAPTVLLGLGLALVAAPASIRAGAGRDPGPTRSSWSLAASRLPGGGLLSAGRAF
jgi:hypothetical protein